MIVQKRKKIIFIGTTFAMLVLVLLICKMDIFHHGFFSNEPDLSTYASDDFLSEISLDNTDYDIVFSPVNNHFAGFLIYLIQPQGNTGSVIISIYDDQDKKIESIDVDLEEVTNRKWYYIYTSAKYEKGEIYKIFFSAGQCDNIPKLQLVPEISLPEETIKGNALIAYGYQKSTFTIQNKVLIVLFFASIWFIILSKTMMMNNRHCALYVGIFILLTTVLSWNYMYNSMDNNNTSFNAFQLDSETYVSGMIYADRDKISFTGTDQKYYLGRYSSYQGTLYRYDLAFLTDSQWLDGYSRSYTSILINSNSFTKRVAKEGNYILFENGGFHRIDSVTDNDKYLNIHLECSYILSPVKNGNLKNITFYDSEQNPLPKSQITAYKSQYGLQGRIFRYLSRFFENNQTFPNLYLICSISTAAILVLIVMLIEIKYNLVMAFCFFITFWLSPWVVNFARNLYWVEFTWFIPMAVGLYCSLRINKRISRIVCYGACFLSIIFKCLCGYEYITTIMLASVAFLIIDFLSAVVKKNKKAMKLLFRTIIIMGIMALAGFMAALFIHASLRGDGNIVQGIQNIIEQDALRRTSGTNFNKISAPAYIKSLNASVLDVLGLYFHFSTQIITGIPGNLFPLYCTIPLLLFFYSYKKNQLDPELPIIYFILMITSISWFVLAKGHSYIHTHMNYVLWYFGFVQICLYIIVNGIKNFFLSLSSNINN